MFMWCFDKNRWLFSMGNTQFFKLLSCIILLLKTQLSAFFSNFFFDHRELLMSHSCDKSLLDIYGFFNSEKRKSKGIFLSQISAIDYREGNIGCCSQKRLEKHREELICRENFIYGHSQRL